MKRRLEDSDRFDKYVNHSGPWIDHLDSSCWLWEGPLNGSGYGCFQSRVDGKPKTVMAHRWVYQLLVGPIPAGLTMDHLCSNKPCVNPEHLEPVTQRVNNLRALNPPAVNSLKTHCPQGHPYEGWNLIQSCGYRYCRTCMYERSKEYKRRKRLEKNAQH